MQNEKTFYKKNKLLKINHANLITPMTKEQKLHLLNKLSEKAKGITTTSCASPLFKDWKILVERTFVKIFGESSIEVTEFKKLNFQSSSIHFSLADENAMQHVAVYKAGFETTLKFINQYTEEIKEEAESESTTEQTTDKTLSKIEWKGTQKELAELFIELKSKGWINEIDADLIQNYFSDSKTIKQVLKPSKDKQGNANYDGVYTKAYKPKFDSIKINEKEK